MAVGGFDPRPRDIDLFTRHMRADGDVHSHSRGLPATCVLCMFVRLLVRACLPLRLVGRGLVVFVTPDDKEG